LLGSRYYVEHPLRPLEKTIADINLEQLGRTDVDGGTRRAILNATGFDFTNIAAILDRAAKPEGVAVLKDEKDSNRFYTQSDNLPFAEAGVPATTISVGYLFPDEHEPGDEWPKLDYANMAKVDTALALGVLEIANAPDPPRWIQPYHPATPGRTSPGATGDRSSQ
jgi:Zn-dependent M28 family amino/carboxypeptidase